jgi:hypothetical protein
MFVVNFAGEVEPPLDEAGVPPDEPPDLVANPLPPPPPPPLAKKTN